MKSADMLKALIVAIAVTVVTALLFSFIEETLATRGGSALVVFIAALVASFITLFLTRGVPKLPQETASVFVGNLAFKASTEDLRRLFAKYGEIRSVRIMTDKITHKPRGFGFVEMGEKDAERAIRELDGEEFLGRKLRVNEGKSRREQQGG